MGRLPPALARVQVMQTHAARGTTGLPPELQTIRRAIARARAAPATTGLAEPRVQHAAARASARRATRAIPVAIPTQGQFARPETFAQVCSRLGVDNDLVRF